MRKRDSVINIRVTDKEKLRIRKNADFSRLSVSEYLRQIAVGMEIKEFPLEDFYKIYKSVCELKHKINRTENMLIYDSLEDISQRILEIYLREIEEDHDGSDEDLADKGQH